jgi:hypothetical protein
VPEPSILTQEWQRDLRRDGGYFHGHPFDADRCWSVAIFPVLGFTLHDTFYWEEAEVYVYDCYNACENIGLRFRFTTDINEDGFRDEVVDYIRAMILPIVRIRTRQTYSVFYIGEGYNR